MSAIPGDPDASKIVRSIAAMAASLGIAVVAEGVETTTQRRFLADTACGVLQGFLFSHAVGASEVPALLAAGFVNRIALATVPGRPHPTPADPAVDDAVQVV